MLGVSGGVTGAGGAGGVQKIDMSLFTSVASLRSSHTMGPAVVGGYAGGGVSTTVSASPSSVVGAAAPPPPAIGSARTGVTTAGVARQYPTTFLGPTISTVPPSPTRSKGSPLGAGATSTAAPSRTGTSYVEALQRQRQEIADRVLAEAQQHRVTRRDSRARSPSSAQSSTAALLVESTNKGSRAKAAAVAAQRPASQSPSRIKRSTSPPSSLVRRDLGRPRTTGNGPLPPARTASPRTQAAIQRLTTAEAAGRKRIVEAAFLVYQSLDTLHRLPTPPPSPRRRSPRQSPSGLTSQRGAAPAVAPMGFLAPRLLQTSAASDDDALSQRFDVATPFSAATAAAAASPSTHGGVGSAAFSSTHEAATMQQRVEAELHSLRVLKTELQARDAMREAEWQAEKVLWAQERRDFANALQQLKSELDAEKKVSEGLRVQLRMACRALRPGHAVGSSAPPALEP